MVKLELLLMPTYKIIYSRKDMPIPCSAIKTAHTQEQAVSCLCAGNKRDGYTLKKPKKLGITINITDIQEL